MITETGASKEVRTHEWHQVRLFLEARFRLIADGATVPTKNKPPAGAVIGARQCPVRGRVACADSRWRLVCLHLALL